MGVGRGVKEMWKIHHFEIVGIQPKCFGKQGQSHGEDIDGRN